MLISMRIGVVINPVCGSHRRRASPEACVAAVERVAGYRGAAELETVVTTGPRHAADLARGFAARQFDVVMAWGGDGTVNEVAGPLIGTATALGIIPRGSGDGFAHALGLPTDVDAALGAAIDRPAVPVDVGYLGGRHFLNVASVGFDAAVARAFDTGGERRGVWNYTNIALRHVWSYRAESYAVTLDGRSADANLFLLAFANGREYGNGMVIAADADFRDGWLDAVLVDAGPVWRQFWRARRLSVAVRRPAQGIRRVRVQTATVRAKRLACQVDGEPFDAAGAVDVRIAPGALRVAGLAPQAGTGAGAMF
jgi:YegS/Rv2252/BmrU family lipid kinase